MTSGELQERLFQEVKNRLTEGRSLPGEIAALLGISADSAYRRIRGEKTLSLDELQAICVHFRISMDQVMQLSNGGMQFFGKCYDRTNFRFEDYMGDMIRDLSMVNNAREKQFYFFAKDLPVFYLFQLRELAAFKWFFWLKTYFQDPAFEHKKMTYSEFPGELFVQQQQALDLYNRIPCVEIWNIESMNIIFRQIDFYWESRVFASDRDILILLDAIEQLWNHLEKQAALGYKFNIGDPDQKPMGEIRMYYNEVLLGYNNILVEMDGQRLSFINHSTINYMMTRDQFFCQIMYNHLQNLMQRSTLISEVSEKERSRFFRIIREKIDKRRKNLRP